MKKLALALLFCILPALASAAPIGNPIAATQNTTAAGSIILKASQGWLSGFSVTSAAAAGYVLIFDSATVPGDGTVTPKLCYEMAANSTIHDNWGGHPIPFINGIVLVYSSTGCFSKTISATAFFSGQIQ